MFTQLLWTSTKAGAAAVADAQGFIGPGRASALLGAPAQTPCVSAQARSPARTVWLVPSVMSAKRVWLLR